VVVNLGRTVVGEMKVSEDLKISSPERREPESLKSESQRRLSIPIKVPTIKVPKKVRELQQSRSFPLLSILIILGIFLLLVLAFL
jgi:hypothetical protein